MGLYLEQQRERWGALVSRWALLLTVMVCANSHHLESWQRDTEVPACARLLDSLCVHSDTRERGPYAEIRPATVGLEGAGNETPFQPGSPLWLPPVLSGP